MTVSGDPEMVLALDIGGTKLAAGLVDPAGVVEGHRAIPTNARAGAEQAIGRALDLVDEILAAASRRSLRPRALGVSSNGITTEHGVALAPSVPGWSSLSIPTRLRERFPGLETVVVNDVKAATLAEMKWGSLRDVDHGIYVNVGTGLAAGLVVRGQLWEGAHGAAGEIGYIAPTLEDVPAAPDGVAPLEERLSGRGVLRWTESELGRPMTIAELINEAQSDDTAEAALTRFLSEVGLWVANLAVVVDPERVVLGGGLARASIDVCGHVEAVLARVVPFRVAVVKARFGGDSSLLGAGAAALAAARES